MIRKMLTITEVEEVLDKWDDYVMQNFGGQYRAGSQYILGKLRDELIEGEDERGFGVLIDPNAPSQRRND